jgi:hypothetical protein
MLAHKMVGGKTLHEASFESIVHIKSQTYSGMKQSPNGLSRCGACMIGLTTYSVLEILNSILQTLAG